jgi:hypothetical protein
MYHRRHCTKGTILRREGSSQVDLYRRTAGRPKRELSHLSKSEKSLDMYELCVQRHLAHYCTKRVYIDNSTQRVYRDSWCRLDLHSLA